MSSFKRKTTSKQASLPVGTRPCPSSSLTVLTSTGIPSLDDILGGGLPLSCSLLVIAPDQHTLYGELVQKYFIAQGLACGQNLCVIDEDAKGLVQQCMWLPPTSTPEAREDEDEGVLPSDNIKIAWRYAQMGRFQTTVSSSNLSDEEYCRGLDLTCRIPRHVVDAAIDSGQLTCLGVTSGSISEILCRIEQGLSGENDPRPVRISIPSFGSPQWGDVDSEDVLQFLHSLRRLLRRYKHACACLCLPPQRSSGDAGWIQKLGWVSDAAISLSAFNDPALLASFPNHHGLVDIHSLPAPHTILPPSDKFSALRGLSSAGCRGGSGENNLAFRCTRKRIVFATLHLDVEGGVGERRTRGRVSGGDVPKRVDGASAAVEVVMEEDGGSMIHPMVEREGRVRKKKVAFQSDWDGFGARTA